ncbi:lytic transglycosylase domain-containing protein [Oryzomonas rubra]|uniref:lytic transglycosylase domain-containing protein n=1 Tax=Oryzomonas rubra TaxID=2509454 RepID=UPI00165E1A89|nr:lytic transglycosylase domain-containing protein [Oryzomonas rubra]
MIRLSIVLGCLLLPAATAGSGDYARHVSPEKIEGNRAGRVLLKPRSDLSKRIERFARKHGAGDRAPEIADVLATCDHPRVLAAIAARESRFDLHARGRAGEIGAYQIMPHQWGHPGHTWSSQTRSAERILDELVDASGGRLALAVRRYNGAGANAEQYSKHVLALANSI